MKFILALIISILVSVSITILIIESNIVLPLWVHFIIGITCGITVTYSILCYDDKPKEINIKSED